MNKTPEICIYHSPCADGFGAAWAVWKRFGDEVNYVPGVYGNPPPDVNGKNVVMVDFSYKSPVLDSLLRSGDAKQAMTILIIDHHKTAQEDLSGIAKPEKWEGPWPEMAYDPYGWRSKWEGAMEWPVRAVFDMEKSGAVLTWEFFHPGARVPQLLRYVEDRDLWRFALRRSRDMAAYVFSQPYDFELWSEMAEWAESPSQLDAMLGEGAAIERKHHKDIGELLDQTRRTMRIGGYEVPVANLPYTMASDAAGTLAEGNPFGACYFDRGDGQRQFSLRSRGNDGVDVSEIAKSYGGGGHKNAAGFQVPLGWEGDVP